VDRLTRLLVEARDGNPRSLEQFIIETQSQVVRICRYLGDPDTAEDLAQESYERAIASLHRYRAEGSGLHWLLTIVRRTCADTTRNRVRRRRLSAAALAEATTANRALPHVRHSIEMDDLLARLDPDRRVAFVLTQVSGLRYAEAAAVLGCPVGTIRSRVARARVDLVEMLNPATASPDITYHKRSSS
jgi:RNA polymerase sigma-70 factor (ECF subfamily)